MVSRKDRHRLRLSFHRAYFLDNTCCEIYLCSSYKKENGYDRNNNYLTDGN